MAISEVVRQFQSVSHSVVKLLAIHANVRLYKNKNSSLLYPELEKNKIDSFIIRNLFGDKSYVVQLFEAPSQTS
jgi:hypothetical protein